MVEIREFCERDIQDCRALIASSAFFQSYGVNPDRFVESLLSSIKRAESSVYVALWQGALAGFRWVIRDGGFDRTPYLRLLAVDDRMHRKGIGRALMAHMEKVHAGARDLMLLVTQSNTKARQFYESLGYKKVGLLENYVQDGVHECIYQKRL